MVSRIIIIIQWNTSPCRIIGMSWWTRLTLGFWPFTVLMVLNVSVLMLHSWPTGGRIVPSHSSKTVFKCETYSRVFQNNLSSQTAIAELFIITYLSQFSWIQFWFPCAYDCCIGLFCRPERHSELAVAPEFVLKPGMLTLRILTLISSNFVLNSWTERYPEETGECMNWSCLFLPMKMYELIQGEFECSVWESVG